MILKTTTGSALGGAVFDLTEIAVLYNTQYEQIPIVFWVWAILALVFDGFMATLSFIWEITLFRLAATWGFDSLLGCS